MFAYDEAQVTKFIQSALSAYVMSGKAPDAGALVWLARMQWEAAIMGYPLAVQRMLAALAVSLGSTPQPAESIYHIGPGAPSVVRAGLVVFHTAAEFPQLLQIQSTTSEMIQNAAELRDRTIWHLAKAEFQKVGQNVLPTTVNAPDQVTVYIDNAWKAFQIVEIGLGADAGDELRPHGSPSMSLFTFVESISPDESEGIPD